MREVVLPQAFRASVPPLASVLIALLKNTSVAAAFGVVEATARMRFFTNDNADDRAADLPRLRARLRASSSSSSRSSPTGSSALEGGADERHRPLRRPRARAPGARHRIYTVIARRRPGRGWSRWSCGGSTTRASSPTTCGSRSSPRDYVEALLSRACSRPCRWPSSRSSGAVVFGLSSASASSPTTRWIRWPCWLVVEFFRAVPVLLLMIFFFYSLRRRRRRHRRRYWCVVVALTLYNGAVLAEVFRAGDHRRAAGPGGGGVRHRACASRQVMNIVLLPQAVKIMLPGDHQPVRGGAEGHQPRLLHRSRPA